MRILSVAVLAVATFSVPITSAAQSSEKPLRHLVFGFQWGTTSTITEHNSGFGTIMNPNTGQPETTSGTGITNYRNHAGDEGTISIDVMREQPDRGLVVAVSEDARDNRSAKPATCVVYGSGSIICDPALKVNPEEYSAVRFLGANFVDPALIDAKQHWQIGSYGPDFSATSDYTIGHNNGGVMTITESRNITFTGARHGSAVVDATIGYDFNRTVPMSLDELTMERVQNGHDYTTVRTLVHLTLQSDSLPQGEP